LGLLAEPGSGGFGVGLEVRESEWRWAKHLVAQDARAEGVLVSVQDEVPYGYRVLGEARADLAPLLD
jgi:hypothetical protein